MAVLLGAGAEEPRVQALRGAAGGARHVVRAPLRVDAAAREVRAAAARLSRRHHHRRRRLQGQFGHTDEDEIVQVATARQCCQMV